MRLSANSHVCVPAWPAGQSALAGVHRGSVSLDGLGSTQLVAQVLLVVVHVLVAAHELQADQALQVKAPVGAGQTAVRVCVRCSFRLWEIVPDCPAGQSSVCVPTRVSALVSVEGDGSTQLVAQVLTTLRVAPVSTQADQELHGDTVMPAVGPAGVGVPHETVLLRVWDCAFSQLCVPD